MQTEQTQGLAEELAELIETRLLGVPLDEQDLELENDDWHTILTALRQHEQMREALIEAQVTLAHARVFIGSREKMHPVGQSLYDETKAKIDTALNKDKPHDRAASLRAQGIE